MILPDLIDRLLKAEGPSRELDWLVAEKFGDVPPHTIRPIGWDYDWYRSSETEYALWKATDAEGRSHQIWHPNPITASIDAAIAFKDRVLPEWETSIFIAEECVCTVKSPDPKSKASIILPSGKHMVPAIALVIAVLRALAEHEEARR